MLFTYAPAGDQTRAAGSKIRHYHFTVKSGSYSKAVLVLINYALPHLTLEASARNASQDQSGLSLHCLSSFGNISADIMTEQMTFVVISVLTMI